MHQERIEKNRQQALKRRAQALEKQKQDAEAAAATAIAPAVSMPASDAITGTGSIGVGDGELQAPRAAFEGSVGHEGGEGAKTASSSLEPVSGISAQPPAHRKRKVLHEIFFTVIFKLGHCPNLFECHSSSRPKCAWIRSMSMELPKCSSLNLPCCLSSMWRNGAWFCRRKRSIPKSASRSSKLFSTRKRMGVGKRSP